jgi:hypothetical protein
MCFCWCQQTTLNINNTVVATIRNSYRTDMCIGYFNITDTDRDAATSLMNSYKSQFNKYNFKLLSNNFVQTVVENHLNTSTVKTADIAPIILYTIPHGICFILLVFLWPFLCCCCVCPGNSKITQKNILHAIAVAKNRSRCIQGLS